ncbi:MULTISPECIES: hypothetical protein [Bacillus cereus group]|uniref:DUF2726 domain-containing protein n=2 Tax=Bacillus cereus group TaxID=86661 RepID=A0AAW5L2Z4_BACCE|nr:MULTISPECIES: hypothetical protein [Bacillus cereus group]MCQ6285594.1 hypothetical protein [Bacillus cereus]MCQ6303440.1 hypothetical protein [Bacillus cereus]MCQ6314454.1 hypothetical protein [Bacillus cereus]MCQ6327472.1 hypothetical protein [Bacillus cereus]MCQ6340182.1 hypothetical protein [Bacillus cereus]
MLEKKLLNLEILYKNDFPKVSHYVNGWLGDAFLFLGDFESAWKYTSKREYRDWARHLEDFLNLGCRDKNQKLSADSIDSIFNISENLTEFGNNNLQSIKQTINQYLDDFHRKHKQNLLYYSLGQNKIKKADYEKHLFTGISDVRLIVKVSFENSKTLYKPINKQVGEFIRECENRYRAENNLPLIGEGWISETVLYYQMKELFPSHQVLSHAKLDFLGLQHLDIYFPELKLAIEYQGEQHSKPVSRFGGEKAFQLNRERDARKKDLCEKNGVSLLYAYPGYDLRSVVNEIIQVVDKKGKTIEIDKTRLENPSLYQLKQELQNKEKLTRHTNNNGSNNPVESREDNKGISSYENIQFENNIKAVKKMLSSSKTVLDKVYNQEYLLQSYYRHCYKTETWTKEFEELGLELINSYQSTYESICKLDKYEVSFEAIEWKVNDFRRKVTKDPDNLKCIIDVFLLGKAFELMAKAYTYQEEYQKAITISELALSHGIRGSRKTGFQGRIQRLQKKINKVKQGDDSNRG